MIVRSLDSMYMLQTRVLIHVDQGTNAILMGSCASFHMLSALFQNSDDTTAYNSGS